MSITSEPVPRHLLANHAQPDERDPLHVDPFASWW